MRLISGLPLIIYTLLCLMGLVRFELWSQVIYIWDSDFSLSEILSDYHGIRYLLVFPIFQLSHWLGVSYNWIFSIVVPGIIFLIAWFATQSTQKLCGSGSSFRRSLVFASISIAFILLSLLMNGRLIFAMGGSSILLWALLSWHSNSVRVNFLAVLAAIVLCSVSSGAFLITIMAFYIFLTITLMIDYPELNSRTELMIYALLLVVLMPHVTMLVAKLVEFFGGGMSSLGNMASHGYSALIAHWPPVLMTIGGMIVLGLVYRYREIVARYWVVSSLIVLYLAGGIFGIATATVAFPPLLVVLSSVILKSFVKADNNTLLK
ncbi:MAG: hypothetical protein ACR2QW_02535 [bacterium]